jgi:hypothetical protein
MLVYERTTRRGHLNYKGLQRWPHVLLDHVFLSVSNPSLEFLAMTEYHRYRMEFGNGGSAAGNGSDLLRCLGDSSGFMVKIVLYDTRYFCRRA